MSQQIKVTINDGGVCDPQEACPPLPQGEVLVGETNMWWEIAYDDDETYRIMKTSFKPTVVEADVISSTEKKWTVRLPDGNIVKRHKEKHAA